MMKFLIETGSERHTSSWQYCKSKYVGGEHDGKHLYGIKSTITQTEWLKVGEDGVQQNAQVVRTVYELPEGTRILIDYNGYAGPEKLIIRLDPSQEVLEYEIGLGRLRTYTMKGRYVVERDLVAEEIAAKNAAKTEGF